MAPGFGQHTSVTCNILQPFSSTLMPGSYGQQRKNHNGTWRLRKYGLGQWHGLDSLLALTLARRRSSPACPTLIPRGASASPPSPYGQAKLAGYEQLSSGRRLSNSAVWTKHSCGDDISRQLAQHAAMRRSDQ